MVEIVLADWLRYGRSVKKCCSCHQQIYRQVDAIRPCIVRRWPHSQPQIGLLCDECALVAETAAAAAVSATSRGDSAANSAHRGPVASRTGRCENRN